LTKKNCFENAFFIVSKIDNIIKRIQVFSSLSTLLKNQNLFNKSYFVMEKALILVDKLNSDNSKDNAFKGISYQFMKQGKIKEALDCSSKITIDSWKFSAIKNISIDLAKKGQHKRALEITSKLNRLDKIVVLAFVSSEFFNLGMLDDSFNLMQEVNNLIQDESSIREKSLSLTFISGELIKQGMINEGITALQDALALTELIKDENDKKISLRAISCEFAKQGKYDNALNCARSINIEHDRSYALKCISNELVKSGKLDEAFKCAQIIENKIYKYDAINIISFELAKNEIWQLSEKIVMEISQLNEKHNCWKYLGSNFFYIDGWNKALHNVKQLKSDEARLFYLKGWADSVTVSDATIELVTEALPYFINDTESIEKILQLHALHEVVFNVASAKKIEQLNSTLNIQWFLDIYKALPQPQTATRLSTNLDTWLHEIEDEDDRDQVMLWAKQVAKGKITEEEFQAKIKAI
jgi:tetratricopeptide (TPR) repeat protein